MQVVKDPLKTKGARLSMELAIAGRYMVYAPDGEGVGVSRRLDDKERDRLRKEAKQLDLGGGGAIVRTAAHGAKRADFERELQYLFKLNEVLAEARRGRQGAGDGLPGGRPLGARRARHLLRALRARDRRRPEAAPPPRVVLHAHRARARRPRRAVRGGRAAVRALRDRGRDRGDALPPGRPAQRRLPDDRLRRGADGHRRQHRLVHRPRQGARLEDTITKTNLEAAEEVVRQLRLRDIGGIIVIDFIDMARARNRDAVLKTLRKALDEDRTKTFTAEISPLGLVEMTRQNVTDGVREIMTRHCPTCDGEGVIRSEETIAIEIERALRELAEGASRRRGVPRADQPARDRRVHRPRRARCCTSSRATPARSFHFEGSRGPAARPLRDHVRGHARGGRGARAAVPRGRRGARPDRRAAHVRGRRRRGQDRRLHHLR